MEKVFGIVWRKSFGKFSEYSWEHVWGVLVVGSGRVFQGGYGKSNKILSCADLIFPLSMFSSHPIESNHSNSSFIIFSLSVHLEF